MIDANVSWRSSFSTADANAISSAGKNGDGDDGESGTAAGDAFRAHIQRIAAVQGTGPHASDTGEQTLPLQVFNGRGSFRQGGAAGADASQTAAQSDSSSGASASGGTFDVALRLAVNAASNVTGNNASAAAGDNDDTDGAANDGTGVPSDGSSDDAVGILNDRRPGGAGSVAGPGNDKESDSPAGSSTPSPDGTLDANSAESLLQQTQEDETSDPSAAAGAVPQRDKGAEDGSARAVPPWLSGPTTPAAGAAQSQGEISKQRFVRSDSGQMTTTSGETPPTTPVLSPNSSPQSAALPDQTSTDEKARNGDPNAASTSTPASVLVSDIVAQNSGDPRVFSRRAGKDEGAAATPVGQLSRSRDKAASAAGDSSSAATGSMIDALTFSTAPGRGDASTMSARDAGADADGDSVGSSTALDRLSVAPDPMSKHVSAASTEPDQSTLPAAVVVSVLEQSRSLAPPVVTSLMRQVADPIIAAGHAITAAGGTQAPTGDVKSLEIQLVPENLGTVTIKMRLAGDGLQVAVEADRQGTLRLLTDSKDALSQSIEASGYKLDSMTLQASSSASSNASGFNSGQAPQGQPQGHGSGSQSSFQGSGSSPGSSQQGQDRSHDQAHFGRGRDGRSGETADGYTQESDRDRRSRSIYV